jgi:hypothetical protein
MRRFAGNRNIRPKPVKATDFKALQGPSTLPQIPRIRSIQAAFAVSKSRARFCRSFRQARLATPSRAWAHTPARKLAYHHQHHGYTWYLLFRIACLSLPDHLPSHTTYHIHSYPIHDSPRCQVLSGIARPFLIRSQPRLGAQRRACIQTAKRWMRRRSPATRRAGYRRLRWPVLTWSAHGFAQPVHPNANAEPPRLARAVG